MRETTYLAVYGTLKREFELPILEELQSKPVYLGRCIIPGKLYINGRLPAIKLGNGQVKGELYFLGSQKDFNILDEYESVDSKNPTAPGYSRRLVTLIEPQKKAWVYEYDGKVDDSNFIKTGKWIKHK